MADLDRLQADIGHHFSMIALLETAVTHASFSAHNNQRLEYLGDALLGFVISDLLFQKHPLVSEGALTRLRAHLVCKKTLVVIAKKIQLDRYFLVGKSINGNQQSADGMLADGFEAIVAAVYLDAGHAAVARMVAHCYRQFFAEDFLALVQKDAKTNLQEFCQKHQYALPEYTVVEQADAKTRFAVSVSIERLQLQAYAEAASKREAQQRAAGNILDQLQTKGLWSNGQS